MKAISVKQPWATLIAMGVQTRDTRNRRTRYRGPLAIQASEEPIRTKDPDLTRILVQAGYKADELPRGCILAVCVLVDCRKIMPANCPCFAEYACGGFSPGYYEWSLSRVRKLDEPIQARGGPGLWEWTPVGMDRIRDW